MKRFFSQFGKAFQVGTTVGGPSLVVQTLIATFFSIDQNFVTEAIGQTLPKGVDTANVPVTSESTTPLRSWVFPGQEELNLASLIDTQYFVQRPMVGTLNINAGNYQVSLLQNASNLWQLCEMYSNRIINEFFIDTRDLVPGYNDASNRAAYEAQQFLMEHNDPRATTDIDQGNILDATTNFSLNDQEVTNQRKDYDNIKTVVALVHRQLPYDTYSFYSLPTNLVYETETFLNETGYSEHDVVNMFRIKFPGLVVNQVQDLKFGTVINRSSIEKHGLRRYEGESIYFYTGPLNEFAPTFRYYSSLITTWNAYNERLRSGAITMRFRPDIRVGTRLTYVSTTYNGDVVVSDYYIQRVSHSFSANAGASRTTVDLVRGIVRGGLGLSTSPESQLIWQHPTDDSFGSSLHPNPYVVVASEDVMLKGKDLPQPATIPVAKPAPKK